MFCRRVFLLGAFAVVSLAALRGSGTAATLRVKPDGSGDFPTIQAAVDAARAGDVVELDDGVFCGDGNRDVNFGGKTIAVESRRGDPFACIIDCHCPSDSTGAVHRAFRFNSQETAFSVLQGVTIRHGRAGGTG